MFDLAPFPDAGVRGVVLTVVALLWLVLLVRLVGVRALSKMTSFDFAVTLASASLLATAATATEWTVFLQALVAMGVLLGTQVALARLRRRSPGAKHALENRPLLLMRDGRFIDDALAASRVSRDDVLAKLRGANAVDLSAVRAVVLETTGDISVLHGRDVDPALLQDVRGT